ncbi:MAG TPA: hypothetical protein VGG39_09645 [Polyangiaceae bacterium]|jgi:hypothetical protein
MKRVFLAAFLAACAVSAGGMVAVAAPPKAAGASSPADAPTVTSLASLMERDLHWGMSHTEVIDTYDRLNGLFDREYAPQLAKLQPGIDQQQLEADRDNRKANFERSFTEFKASSPTGYDVTPLHLEYTYNNGESVLKLFKDGKNRFFFFMKDRLWKLYDEIPLKADGALGGTYQAAVTKLNTLFSVPARIRAAGPSQGLERTEADWQDGRSHLRAVDRSGEHLIGIVLEDKNTLANLTSLRANKPVDPFALDPSIAALTRKGVSDPNAGRAAPVDAGAKKNR